MDTKVFLNKKYNGSITVEAAFSFTITIFVFFIMLGPLLIIKSSSDVLIKLNEAANTRCNYEMIKKGASETNIVNKINSYFDKDDNIKEISNGIENILNFGINAINILNQYDDDKREYRNISFIYDKNTNVYDGEKGIVKYDYLITFMLPYNVLHVRNIMNRFVIQKRAFIGVDGNRFKNDDESNGYIYVSDSYRSSGVYHNKYNCSYLIKDTIKSSYKDIKRMKNDNGGKYTKCSHCFGKKKVDENEMYYITQYGDKYHYDKDCPMMTAYITKVPSSYIDTYNLRMCERCKKSGGNED